MRLLKRSAKPSLTFEAYGVKVQVTADNQNLVGRLQDILPPGAQECRPDNSAGRFVLHQNGAEDYEVLVGETSFANGSSLEVALGLLDQQVRLYIAYTAREWIFVHAGTVAVDGRAIVVPGPSFSGKTTLVAALVQMGATYFSDEYAVVDPEGQVHPYPRPLSIRSPDGRASTERPVDDLGGDAGDRAVEVAVVAAIRYRPGAQWQPARMSPGRGVAALLSNTVPAQDRPKESLRSLKHAVASALVLEGERGEAAQAADALLAELKLTA